MTHMQVTIPSSIHERLGAALLDETDLLEFLRQARREPLPDAPGRARCTGTLPVRRALDPETSELVRVAVILEQRGDGWEVVDIEGL